MRSFLLVPIFAFVLAADSGQAKIMLADDASSKILMLASDAAPYLARYDGRTLTVRSDPSGAVGLYDEAGALALCAGTVDSCLALTKKEGSHKLARVVTPAEQQDQREALSKNPNAMHQIMLNNPPGTTGP